MKKTISGYAMFGSSGCDMSQATTISNVTNTLFMDNVGIVVSWSGSSCTGQIFIDASNDYGSAASPTWVTLDFGSNISIAANSGTHVLNINNFPYTAIRARYVKSAGTGTLNLTLTVKEVGG